MQGVQTDESKSVSGELEESDNASDNSHDLFNAVLDVIIFSLNSAKSHDEKHMYDVPA